MEKLNVNYSPPRIPTKNLRAMRPRILVTSPAIAVGMAPAKSTETNVHRGPNRSHNGPATRRTRRVPHSAAMFELATSIVERLRSFLMVMLNNGGNAYLVVRQRVACIAESHLPGPESDEESEPGEEEHPTIWVHNIEDRNTFRFSIDRVNHWG